MMVYLARGLERDLRALPSHIGYVQSQPRIDTSGWWAIASPHPKGLPKRKVAESGSTYWMAVLEIPGMQPRSVHERRPDEHLG